ncbi:MAG: CBASS cGAMP-activated phospholipase [Pyrinomonadaceae bacterium]
MRSTFRILCIDGGGIRGIIPALVLAELERRTGKRIYQLFDLIAGTSTGGILALGLVKPNKARRAQYTAKQLVQLYETEGHRIFSRSVLHQVLSLGSLLDKKYQSGPIETVLEEYFGDIWLSEALTNVLLTSYEIQLRQAFFFRSNRAKEFGDFDFLMRDAARATSAAPTYFEPELIEEENTGYALIDGGIYANNPAMCALVDAVREFNRGMNQVFMVSLGTGEQTHPLNYQTVKNWGVVNWAQTILSVVFQGVSSTAHYQTSQILNEVGKPNRYHRLQVNLPKGVYGLDNTSPAYIQQLKELAQCLIEKCDNEIDAICKALPGKRSPQRKNHGGASKRARLKPVAV